MFLKNKKLYFTGGFLIAAGLIGLAGTVIRPFHSYAYEPFEVESCGVERWSVKVLTDADASSVNIFPVATTIQNLVTMATPAPNANMPRQTVEKQTYTVHCTLAKIKLESDGDYHLLLEDSNGHTMIGEIPDPTCNATTSSLYIGDIKRCRQFIDKYYSVSTSFQDVFRRVIVTGVAFIDPPHGQTDAAPNNLELHSILDIQYEPVNQHTSGIANAEQAKRNLMVYPNPVHSQATFRLDITDRSISRGAAIRITDITGKQLLTQPWPEGASQIQIPRGNLIPGIYFYELTENGTATAAGKLMVE